MFNSRRCLCTLKTLCLVECVWWRGSFAIMITIIMMVDKADDSILNQDGDSMYIAVIYVCLFIITKIRHVNIFSWKFILALFFAIWWIIMQMKHLSWLIVFAHAYASHYIMEKYSSVVLMVISIWYTNIQALNWQYTWCMQVIQQYCLTAHKFIDDAASHESNNDCCTKKWCPLIDLE